MKNIVVLLTMLVVVFSPSAALLAGDKKAEDKKAEVKALVEQGVALVQKEGKDAAFKVINDLKGPFVKGDLYLFATSLKNIDLAEGSPNNKALIGKDLSQYQAVVKMTEVAKTKGSGWVEYSWPKPGENVPSPKRSFVMRVPGQDFYIGCGYYLK